MRSIREFAAQDPQNPPPIRIAMPGMCFRYEQITARSEIRLIGWKAWPWAKV